jgi:carbonic anhydrase/acetyltransferase-like protein (isoleucine patch superfamily)
MVPCRPCKPLANDPSMALYKLGSAVPQVPASAYIAPGATVIGQVVLGENVTVMPGAVLRADNDVIRIGDNTNVQDGAVLHVDPGIPMSIGRDVTIGHQAMLHGCTIGDGTLVGIQAIVYNRAVVGRDCLVAAGAFIAEGKVFADRLLLVGAPAKVIRTLSDDDVRSLRGNVEAYVKRGVRYRQELQRVD